MNTRQDDRSLHEGDGLSGSAVELRNRRAQLVLHGSLIIVVAANVEPPLVMLGGRLTARLHNSPIIAAWFDRTLGPLLIALAARLAWHER